MIVSRYNAAKLEQRYVPFVFLVKMNGEYNVHCREMGRTHKVSYAQINLLGFQTILKHQDLKGANQTLKDYAFSFRMIGDLVRAPMEIVADMNVLTVYEQAKNRFYIVKLAANGEVEVKSNSFSTYKEAFERLNVVSRSMRCNVIANLLCNVKTKTVHKLPNIRAM